MDKGSPEHKAAKTQGAVKEAIGKITGHGAAEADGAVRGSAAAQPRRILGLAKARTALDDKA